MREPDLNRQSRVQSPACYRYTIPLCNTLSTAGRSPSARQRAFAVLQISVKPCQVFQVALHGLELILQGTQAPGSGIIAVREILQIPTAAGDAGFYALQLLLLFRQEHIAVINQAFKFLGEIIPNLLVDYIDQLVRETN